MFVVLTTQAGEQVAINMNHVLEFRASKKGNDGTRLVLSSNKQDGATRVIAVRESMTDIMGNAGLVERSGG